MKIKFIKNESNIPFVNVTLNNGNELVAIIDTGSDSTTADLSVLKNNKDCVLVSSKVNDINFLGVFSTENAKSIPAKTDIRFDKHSESIPIEFDILNLAELRDGVLSTYGIVPDMIIGSNFLNKHNAKIDYKNSVLVI